MGKLWKKKHNVQYYMILCLINIKYPFVNTIKISYRKSIDLILIKLVIVFPK